MRGRQIRFAKTVALLTGLTSPALAQDAITTPFDGRFDDATFAVETAIVNEGLVIDYISHVGDMLARTGGDVGSDATIFDAADIFLVCCAVVSRQVTEADPMNIAHCPYGIFVADRDGTVVIGYRSSPDGPMQAVQTLLADIVAEATAVRLRLVCTGRRPALDLGPARGVMLRKTA